MRPQLLVLLLQFGLSFAVGLEQGIDPRCRCVPGDKCWPSQSQWRSFEQLLGRGKLIRTSPIAESCYNGARMDLNYNPVGRPYPYNITCTPVNYTAGETPTACTLGSLPVYAVNATTRKDVALTLKFAKHNNIRLVTSTGHDLLGRSDGYGGLEVWLRHFRNGINFQKTFKSARQCTKSGWKGSALHIDGAWQWRDVYKVAKANNVIAVGHGSLSPGAIGGWSSGGGHGPATRNYGLGADQILEAEVMLANGQIVTANHCKNTDLFRAIRAGGPGYGIVLSQHIKAYPNVDVVVTAHRLAIALLQQTPENADLLDAVSVLLQQFPSLNGKGHAGYGFWFRRFPGPFTEAEDAMADTLKLLEEKKFHDKLSISSTFTQYPDYWSFYDAESGLHDPAGDTSILTSRMIDPKAVSDYKRVRDTVEIISGTPEEVVSNVVLLVSGGQVFQDAADTRSGLHPAWRTSPFVLISGQGIPKVATREVREYVTNQITNVKGAALKRLALDTGGYMNEGDRHDPEYIRTFYGADYDGHLAVKRKYDPEHAFYCPTRVGAEEFVERPDGPLCRKD
ncbi:uncharacterized protein B0T15DRAFT_569148 [Chaetomium strumarium]|uniref:FAD-binding PCMH-type domain-containing protein n=1 Tax=Chaetomium strumarium TaxID=1170767 RepID=A0AAJ0GPP5_9PEZI|nr:hypothetical protein B0T15DRAFT_569148 [Chaetomium strumarium]